MSITEIDVRRLGVHGHKFAQSNKFLCRQLPLHEIDWHVNPLDITLDISTIRINAINRGIATLSITDEFQLNPSKCAPSLLVRKHLPDVFSGDLKGKSSGNGIPASLTKQCIHWMALLARRFVIALLALLTAAVDKVGSMDLLSPTTSALTKPHRVASTNANFVQYSPFPKNQFF